jgi:alpha-1,2-mannosyltransferase
MSSGLLSFDRREPARAHKRALEHLLLGVLPVVLTIGLAIAAVSSHWVAEDFSLGYYPAAHTLLSGGNVYAATSVQVRGSAAFVYPALSAVLLAPFGLFSLAVADHLYTLLCITLVPGTLWTLNVRDWRVYGVVMLWFPIVIGWQGENISVPLMFLVALAWRHRDRPLVAGLITAAAISMKPFIWPLGLWLLATRRWRAAAWALVSGVALNLLAWGIVGFNHISTYLHVANVDVTAFWRVGYGIPAIAHQLGWGRGVGEDLLLLVAAPISAALLHQGLIKRRPQTAFVLAVALILVASPLVWNHYFVLLLVPLGIARPRFGPLWVVPVAMWLLPPATTVDGWQLAFAWTLVAVCVLGALRDAPVGRRSADRRPQAEPPSSLATTG